jgi:Bacterial Ig-like domain (group 3)
MALPMKALMFQRNRLAVIAAIAVMMLPVSLRASIVNVPGSQPTIQAGVNAASDGDTVRVAPGTYSGAGNFNIDTGGRSITIDSSGGAAATVIDMTGASSNNPMHAFDIHSGETVTITGFTIKNGYFANGAITVADSSLTITQCIFVGNKSVSYGGALAIIQNNAAVTVTIQQSRFINNTAGDQTSNSGLGGAIEALVNSPNGVETINIVNSTFAGNIATYDGGAIDVSGFGSTSPTMTIINSTFSGNNANGFVANGSGLPAPAAGHTPGAIDSFQGSVTITNSLVWGDMTSTEYSTLNDPATSGAGSVSINQSGVQGGFAGTGNFTANPLYVDQVNGDFRLLYNSPAIHVGTTVGAPSVDLLGNPRGSNPDVGAYQYILTTTASPIAATPTIPFNGVVATFNDASNDLAPLGAFTASIAWGDGALTAGTISQPGGSGTNYVVSGSHTYAQAGQFILAVTANAATNAPQVTASRTSTATVALLPTLTTVSSSSDTVIFGTPETFTATVTSNGAAVTTGSVTFTDATTATILFSNVGLNNSGQASTAPVFLAPGNHTIQATYNSDSVHSGSFNTTSVTVTPKKRPAQITSQ